MLLPLLDGESDAPVRWADPSFSMDCVDARVSVDGTRPDVDTLVPDTFTVRWQMDRCMPLGPDLEVSGSVELHVEFGNDGYFARIVPDGLTLRSAYGVDVLTEAFTARLPTSPGAHPLGVASASRPHPGS